MRTNIRTVAVTAVGLVVATLIVVTAGRHFQRTDEAIGPPHSAATAPPPRLSYLGVYEPASPASYSGVDEFAQLIGRSPNIAVYYSSWWEPFQLAFARAAVAHQAIPMVQIEPRDVSLAAIAAGRYDAYLRTYAGAVRSLGQPVILSFGHEMNADWYGWGYRHTSPAVFVAAWRHIYNLFAAAGTDNVKWLWTVNVVPGPQVSAIKAWWPGAAYVTWIGIDGHYFQAPVRFAGLFGTTLGQVRALSRQPVLIAETGIAPFVSTERITDLFAGAQAHGLLGVVWFDVKGHNLRVENDPAAIAAFKLAVGNYLTRDAGGRSGAVPAHQ